jgi:hypothetical protein
MNAEKVPSRDNGSQQRKGGTAFGSIDNMNYLHNIFNQYMFEKRGIETKNLSVNWESYFFGIIKKVKQGNPTMNKKGQNTIALSIARDDIMQNLDKYTQGKVGEMPQPSQIANNPYNPTNPNARMSDLHQRQRDIQSLPVTMASDRERQGNGQGGGMVLNQDPGLMPQVTGGQFGRPEFNDSHNLMRDGMQDPATGTFVSNRELVDYGERMILDRKSNEQQQEMPSVLNSVITKDNDPTKFDDEYQSKLNDRNVGIHIPNPHLRAESDLKAYRPVTENERDRRQREINEEQTQREKDQIEREFREKIETTHDENIQGDKIQQRFMDNEVHDPRKKLAEIMYKAQANETTLEEDDKRRESDKADTVEDYSTLKSDGSKKIDNMIEGFNNMNMNITAEERNQQQIRLPFQKQGINSSSMNIGMGNNENIGTSLEHFSQSLSGGADLNTNVNTIEGFANTKVTVPHAGNIGSVQAFLNNNDSSELSAYQQREMALFQDMRNAMIGANNEQKKEKFDLRKKFILINAGDRDINQADNNLRYQFSVRVKDDKVGSLQGNIRNITRMRINRIILPVVYDFDGLDSNEHDLAVNSTNYPYQYMTVKIDGFGHYDGSNTTIRDSIANLYLEKLNQNLIGRSYLIFTPIQEDYKLFHQPIADLGTLNISMWNPFGKLIGYETDGKTGIQSITATGGIFTITTINPFTRSTLNHQDYVKFIDMDFSVLTGIGILHADDESKIANANNYFNSTDGHRISIDLSGGGTVEKVADVNNIGRIINVTTYNQFTIEYFEGTFEAAVQEFGTLSNPFPNARILNLSLQPVIAMEIDYYDKKNEAIDETFAF